MAIELLVDSTLAKDWLCAPDEDLSKLRRGQVDIDLRRRIPQVAEGISPKDATHARVVIHPDYGSLDACTYDIIPGTNTGGVFHASAQPFTVRSESLPFPGEPYRGRRYGE